MATVRQREWKWGGKVKTAWIVDYFDQNHKRRLKTFKTQQAAKTWLANGNHLREPMSEARNLTLERVNRLTQSMADLTESHAAQGRMMTRLLEQMTDRLASIDTTLAALAKDVRALTSEQILLGNRIEEAFARALRTNIRLDELEDESE